MGRSAPLLAAAVCLSEGALGEAVAVGELGPLRSRRGEGGVGGGLTDIVEERVKSGKRSTNDWHSLWRENPPVHFLPASRFWDMRPIAGIVRARQSRCLIYSGARRALRFLFSDAGTVVRVSEAGGA